MTEDHNCRCLESSWVAAVLFIFQDVLVVGRAKNKDAFLRGCLSWTVAWRAYP